MGNGKSFLASSSAFLLIAFFAISVHAQPKDPPKDLLILQAKELDKTLQRRGIDALRKTVEGSKAPLDLVYQAKLALIDGDLGTARDSALDAFNASPDFEVIAGPVLAEALVELGKLDEAEKILRKVLQSKPQAHTARLGLGRLLIEKGSENEGEVVLEAFSGFFNNDLLKTSEELSVLGEAMRLNGQFKDANYAMERAIEKDPRNVQALVQWGDLLMEKYNAGDAEETYKEAIAVNPESVSALVGLARAELELSRDFGKIREYLAKAEMLSPKNPDVHVLFAEVAINDSDCEEAERRANVILKDRSRNLEARTIVASCAYLADDDTRYKKEIKEILAINPRYARVYTEVARYGVRVHRYEEAVKLNELALKIRPDFARALLDIGIGQSRTGEEQKAQDTLKRAFDLDPYNVRSFNMVEMYEREMTDYRFDEYNGFRLRTHKNESAMMNVLVPPLVTEAMREFDKKYNFKPHKYLAVEVFPDPQTFAVRSVGLPSVSPHGICFGKVVVSRSPSDGNFNWRQVIWHELAHVYHIQLAKNRVPRWFTEGLAEYETNVKDPTWSRHHDRELSFALRDDNLRGVLNLSKGFTHAKSFQEILQAYHQSSLVIHFIAQTWSYDALPEMLRTWGAKKKTPEVIQTVLNVTPEQFDEKFKTWLSRRYLNFQSQITVDLASLPTAVELSSILAKNPNDALSWAKLAVAKFRAGDPIGAENAIRRATEISPKHPKINLIAMYYLYNAGRVKDAYERGIAILDSTNDSYDIRIVLGTAAQLLEDKKAAELHFWTATQLWPDGIEAWRSLAKIYRKAKRDKEYEETVVRLFELDQNDPNHARVFTEYFGQKGDWKRAKQGAQRWYDVNPFDTRIYERWAEASLHTKQIKEAKQAWEMWKRIRPTDEKKIVLSAIELLTRTGYNSEASEYVTRAKSLNIPDSKIKKAQNAK